VVAAVMIFNNLFGFARTAGTAGPYSGTTQLRMRMTTMEPEHSGALSWCDLAFPGPEGKPRASRGSASSADTPPGVAVAMHGDLRLARPGRGAPQGRRDSRIDPRAGPSSGLFSAARQVGGARVSRCSAQPSGARWPLASPVPRAPIRGA
jgi:hypothetical protein